MDITINYLAVFVCAVLSLVIGSIWYGPLFGKKWMQFYGPKDATPEMMKAMQKQMMPIYFVQFLIAFFQMNVLAWFVAVLANVASGAHIALGIAIGFVVTTVAGAALWVGDSYKMIREKVLIQSGYQIVFFLVAGYILSVWK